MIDWGEVVMYVVAMGGCPAIFGIYCLFSNLKDNRDYKKRCIQGKKDYERYQYEQEMEKAWKELLNAIGGRR